MPPVAAIEIADLRVQYGEVTAVDGLSFSVDAGRVLALLGPNGAGKTTTVETLEGYRRPTSGTVRVLGLDPIGEHAALVPQIGVMLQRGGIYPGMPAGEAVRLFAAYYNDPEDPVELMVRVGLHGVARTPWRRLSGGEQQRLSLALAMVGRPRVAFLDEPTAGMDPAARQVLWGIVRELRDRGVCVLLTTHYLEEAERLADAGGGHAGGPDGVGRGAGDQVRGTGGHRRGRARFGPGGGGSGGKPGRVPGTGRGHAAAGGGPDRMAGRARRGPRRPAGGAGDAGGRVPATDGRTGWERGGRAAARSPDAAGGHGVRALVAQARAEVAMTLRRGESILLAVGIPVLLLVFFSVVKVLPKDPAARNEVSFLAPGILALAVMSTAMVSLGIATGFERSYGVLKRLGTTPLSRPALLAAKTVAIVVVEAAQIVVLVPVGVALGWSPKGGGLVALAAVALGTIAFAGLGLLMAGTLRAEVTLAAANGLYLALLLLGGMVVPLAKLPGALRAVARVLPSGALSDALHSALGTGAGVPGRAWVVLVVWAVLAPAAAAATFRWE